MGKLRELLDDIDPTGSPLEHARFIRLVIRASLISFAVWSLGTFNYLGFTNTGFVKAGELDPKVQSAVEPLRAEIGKIAKTQAEQAQVQADQDAVLKAIRIDQLESKLRELHAIKCRLLDLEQEGLEQEIESAQRQHRALTGERYTLPRCRGGRNGDAQ